LLLRPRATVVAPDGERWEIWVSRHAFPPWRPITSGSEYEGFGNKGDLIGYLIDAVEFVVLEVLVPAVLFLAELPLALTRSAGRRKRFVEAISWFPARRSLTWTTDPGHVEQVVAELVAQLGQGQPPNPGNATSRP
jgi:hypothetical protein